MGRVGRIFIDDLFHVEHQLEQDPLLVPSVSSIVMLLNKSGEVTKSGSK